MTPGHEGGSGGGSDSSGGAWLRIYRRLLALYPRESRQALEGQLERDFRRVLEEAGRKGGRAKRVRRGLKELWDLVRNLPAAWGEERQRRRESSGAGGDGGLLTGLGPELRQSARALGRRPGYTLAVVLTLGLAVGANTAVFSLVDGILLEPLPYPRANELVYMYESYRETQSMSVSYPNFRDWEEMNRTFRAMGARTGWGFTLTGQGDAQQLSGMLISPNLPDLLGVSPAVGRMFTEDETARRERVVLLSHGLWTSVFGRDPSVPGSTVSLDGEPYTVVGVLPPGLEFPLSDAQVFAPITRLSEGDMESRSNHPGISVVGRLEAGVEVERAREDMERVAGVLAARFPESNGESGVRLFSLKERVVGDAGTILLLLQGAVGLVLLIACANVANLGLVRAVSASRDAGIRAALGAARSRIVRGALVETLLLAGAGGALGVLLARGGVEVVRRLEPGNLPRLQGVGVDGSVLAVTLLVVVAAVLASGIAPALRAVRVEPGAALRPGGSGRGATSASGRLRGGLIVAEVALTFVLLAGAGLMLRTTLNLLEADPGFDTRGLLTARVPLGAKYATQGERADFYRRLLERVEALPGVESAAGVDPVPLGPSNRQSAISGQGLETVDEEGLRTEVAMVTPGYFETLGIPVLAGRAFRGDESMDDPVVVIDETLAERVWPGEDPLNRTLRFRFSDDPPYRVVGVVGHVKNYGVHQGSRVQLYHPYTQQVYGLYLAVRTRGDGAALAPTIREALADLDPEVPLTRVRLMAELEAGSMADETLTARILGLFAGLSLVLALLGLYGVVAYSVSLRTREIGIRMALGAEARRVVRMVVGQGAAMVAGGLVLGLLGAVALTRTLSGLLFGVGSLDPLTLTAAAGLLAVVGTAATLVPALRAASVDPTEALRRE